jgi:hypothetical protein
MGRPWGRVPRAVRYLFAMVRHPYRTTDRLFAESISPALGLVLGYAALMSASFLLSHLARDYPPRADVLATWTDAYGEFYVVPFVNIPAENYRLALAICFVPLVLMVWILMAGSARLLTIAFRGSATFDQYLRLLAFAFFPFWIAASVVDTIHSGPLDPWVLGALRDDYGPVAHLVAANFMPMTYTVLFGLGAVYCGLAAARANGFSLPKSAVIGFASFIWPTAAGAFLIR